MNNIRYIVIDISNRSFAHACFNYQFISACLQHTSNLTAYFHRSHLKLLQTFAQVDSLSNHLVPLDIGKGFLTELRFLFSFLSSRLENNRLIILSSSTTQISLSILWYSLFLVLIFLFSFTLLMLFYSIFKSEQ